jgi:hypothetical protein
VALTYLPAAQANLATDAIFPAATRGRTATATNGTTTLTVPDTAGIMVGMAVTGAGISSGGVVVSTTTTVITISGTITTLTASAYVFTFNPWLSLHTTSPSNTGANEVTGGAGPYARQTAAVSAPSTGTTVTSGAQNFVGMPAATVGFFGVWSALTAGTYEGGGALTSSLTVPAGATVAFAIGALSLAVQG